MAVVLKTWISIALLWLMSFSLLAAPTPEELIYSSFQQLQQLLKNEPNLDAKRMAGFVVEVFLPNVDFNKVSRLALGKYWRRANRVQKQAFKKEFQTLIIRTYANALMEFKDLDVKILPNRSTSNKKRVVKTEVTHDKSQTAVAINYRFYNHKGRWKAYDVMVEGISLVTTYRSTFSKSIRQQGLDHLIKRLAARNSNAS